MKICSHFTIFMVEQVISVLCFNYASEQVFLQKFSYENGFDLDENEYAGETHLYVTGFAQTRSDAEAKGNSKMGYLKNVEIVSVNENVNIFLCS